LESSSTGPTPESGDGAVDEACREGVLSTVELNGLLDEDHGLRLTRLGVGVDGLEMEVAGWATVPQGDSVLIVGILSLPGGKPRS
jgi:hypothetical protein